MEPVDVGKQDAAFHRFEASRRAWMAALPKWPITCAEWDALLEYSSSLPTGTTPGKVWKRHDGSFDREYLARGGRAFWLIGQYDPAAPDEATWPKDKPLPNIAIHYYRPLIRVPAGRRVLPRAVIVHRHTNINAGSAATVDRGDGVDAEVVQPGDVVQLGPNSSNELFAGSLMFVTEVRTWGVKGFVVVLGQGDAHYRAEKGTYSRIGRAKWTPER